MTESIRDFLTAELHFETASALILKDAGLTVVSAFIPLNADGSPNLNEMPEHCAWVTFEMGDCDDTQRAFRTNPDFLGGLSSMPAGYEGILEVWHRVPVTDQAPPTGRDPGCYPRLCAQRGHIRALFLEDENPFSGRLPLFDIRSIRLVQPDRTVQREKQINQAVERFRIAWSPSTTATA